MHRMKKYLKNNIYSIINNELYVRIINIMKNVISVKLSAYFFLGRNFTETNNDLQKIKIKLYT